MISHASLFMCFEVLLKENANTRKDKSIKGEDKFSVITIF